MLFLRQNCGFAVLLTSEMLSCGFPFVPHVFNGVVLWSDKVFSGGSGGCLHVSPYVCLCLYVHLPLNVSHCAGEEERMEAS